MRTWSYELLEWDGIRRKEWEYTLYADEVRIGAIDTKEDAEFIVHALNQAEAQQSSGLEAQLQRVQAKHLTDWSQMPPDATITEIALEKWGPPVAVVAGEDLDRLDALIKDRGYVFDREKGKYAPRRPWWQFWK